jgi:hypothetical protein
LRAMNVYILMSVIIQRIDERVQGMTFSAEKCCERP